MKLIVIITTRLKNINRIKNIENTWIKYLKENNISYYYVTYDDLKNLPCIRLQNHKESYEQLPIKTYLCLEHIETNFDYTHIIKLDDDTFFDFNKFNLNFLNFDYIGKFNKKQKISFYHYLKCKKEFQAPSIDKNEFDYAQGGFYMLSKKAIKIILKKDIKYFINTPDKYKGEDVLIGKILMKEDEIKSLNINDYELSTKHNMDITNNFLSIHPVENKEIMEQLFSQKDKDKILINNQNKNRYNLTDFILKNLI